MLNKKSLKIIHDTLTHYDLIIACGNIFFLTAAGIQVDIYVPYGNDFYRILDPPKFKYKIPFLDYFRLKGQKKYLELQKKL